MSNADPDFLLDAKANTIGALLNHLAATDAFYHANVFGGFRWEKCRSPSRNSGRRHGPRRTGAQGN
jgi:hypothetical protein